MSGTSLDGVDAVLWSPNTGVTAHRFEAFEPALRSQLLRLNQSGPDELHQAALAANAVARAYAQVLRTLLEEAGARPQDVSAAGAHGQTVRHRPELGFTVQLLNAALLAELTGVDIVADLRSRDVAAGGQGAPLVPAFHRAVFGRPDADIAVLNIGGMANLSLLPAQGPTGGFDTGPGNVLLDTWHRHHQGPAFDAGGCWAATGRVLPDLLARWQSEPFFSLPPPRSTGRDLFDWTWLQQQVLQAFSPADVQATLAELTAWSIADALNRAQPATNELIVCGGGAFNLDLLHRLQRHLPQLQVVTSDRRGLPPMQVEATAFAWLAARFTAREPGNLVSVTGAQGPRILGALYPA